MQQIRGEWIPGKNAGGSRNNFEKFATNPQYLLTVVDPTPGETMPRLLVEAYDRAEVNRELTLLLD